MSIFRYRRTSDANTKMIAEKAKYVTDNYKQNCDLANQFKAQWEYNGDPILQRDERYIPKNKAVQLCKLKYEQKIKENEIQKPECTSVNKYGSVFHESKEISKSKSKRFYTPDVTNRMQKDMKPIMRVYPEQYQKAKAAYIIEEKGEIEKQRPHLRVNKSYYKPSDDYIAMNNKINMLPSERRINGNLSFKNSLKNSFNKDSLFTTKSRLFNVQDGQNKEINPRKTRLVHKIEIKEKTDHINGLISYQYSPNFKEPKFTEKPNKTNFNHIVNKTIENLKENFVADPYVKNHLF